MTRKGLEEAISEAERFILRAKILIRSGDNKSPGSRDEIWESWVRGTLESGDCRRASMDLSRVLTKLRKY